MHGFGATLGMSMLLLSSPTLSVLQGSYVEQSSFSASPFRGAVQSGGGSGIVLFADGNEAVVLTVAHGYDLTVKTAQQVIHVPLGLCVPRRGF